MTLRPGSTSVFSKGRLQHILVVTLLCYGWTLKVQIAINHTEKAQACSELLLYVDARPSVA